MLKSYVKVFAATLLALYAASGVSLFDLSVNDLRTWLSAAFSSALPIIITWLDPTDTRWGRTK